MFERYTERARRVIFFARYEASQFGSMSIESDHLLLALIREDKNLTTHFLRNRFPIHDIRKEIEARSVIREKVPTSIDLPLSAESRDILAYANEESERLGHTWIGTEHLLLGILRQGTCPAADILKARGLNLEEIQRELATDFAATQMQTKTGADRLPDSRALILLLNAGQFEETKVHLSKASDAFSQGQLAITQLELRELLNSLVSAIQKRNPNPTTFAPLFSGFDWSEPLREFNSELSTEEDCGFKFQLTLLLAELLLNRYRIQR
jgi:ATP-dependent Clp protease ATP-binding subunit ClpA